MKKLILTILSFCFLLLSQAQNTLNIKLGGEAECSQPLLSKVIIQANMGGSYKTITSLEKDSCRFSIPTFPIPNGKIQLFFENYETVEQNFGFKEANTLDLDIPLKKINSKNLEEVTIFGMRKSFIKAEGGTTIVQVQGNDILANGNVNDALTKLPGVMELMPGSKTLNGKATTIWIDGEDVGLGGRDLNNFLETLPANSVEKIELINNPGAKYDATISGAIINIITNGRALRGLNGSIYMSYKKIADKYMGLYPSITLSGRQGKFSFNFSSNFDYEAQPEHEIVSSLVTYDNLNYLTRQDQSKELIHRALNNRIGIQYKMTAKSTLALNYNWSLDNFNNYFNANSLSENFPTNFNFNSGASDKGENIRNEVVFKYKQKLDDKKRLMEFTASYNNYNAFSNYKNTDYSSPANYSVRRNDDNNANWTSKLDFEIPFDSIALKWNSGAKYTKQHLTSKGLYNNSLNAGLITNPFYDNNLFYDYTSQNFALYTEVSKTFFKNLSLKAGVRWETFDLTSEDFLNNQPNLKYKDNFSNFFPSFNLTYDLFSMAQLNLSYSKKLNLPDYSQLNPNQNGFSNNLFSNSGNPVIEPEFINNWGAELNLQGMPLAAFNYTYAKTQNLDYSDVDLETFQTVTKSETFRNVKNYNLILSLPIPIDILLKGKEAGMAKGFDRMNIIMPWAFYNEMELDTDSTIDLGTGHVWAFGGMGQFILPYDFKFTVYGMIAQKGTFMLYQLNSPIQGWHATLSKEFFNKKLMIELYANDIFNQHKIDLSTKTQNFITSYTDHSNKQAFGINFTWKFGTYNQQEEQIIQEESKGNGAPSIGIGK